MWSILILIIVCFCNTLQVNSRVCGGGIARPLNCTKKPCTVYVATWDVWEDKTVNFTVYTSGLGPNSWVAIGFSTTGDVIGSDIVMYNPKTGKVTDKYVNQDRRALDDVHQDLLSSSVEMISSSAVEMKFTRKLDTGDRDQDVSLNQCIYFLFPYSPGGAGSEEDLTIRQVIPISNKRCPNDCFKQN